MTRTGFTLIELIIVIAIIAILATTVILVLNPAVILAEARDSQRIADLSQLNSALGLYLATSGATLGGAIDKCYVHATATAVAAKCAGRHHTSRTTIDPIPGREVNGDGWVPVDFREISGGSPLSSLPIDPTSSNTLFYSYATDTGSGFELNADMESDKYALEVEAGDGGDKDDLYEVGNDEGLDL